VLASGRCTPCGIFISVDLPAPLPPASACTSPRARVKSTAAQHRAAGEALIDAPHLHGVGARCAGLFGVVHFRSHRLAPLERWRGCRVPHRDAV
jgi:hypothetical protein